MERENHAERRVDFALFCFMLKKKLLTDNARGAADQSSHLEAEQLNISVLIFVARKQFSAG